MQKMIRKYMFIALVLFFVQLVVSIVFFLLYKFDVISYIVEAMVVSLCFFIIIDILYVWIVLSNISKAKIKNDVSAIEIVGEDIQQVYDFGNLGIVIVDDNCDIIWTNDWFEDLQTAIIDRNVYSWIPELEKLSDPKNSTITVDIDQRQYEAKFIKEAKLFIFKDINDFNTVINFSKDHAPVIGLIAIDNYQDVMQLIDDSRTNDLIASIQRIIFDYAKKYGILVRQYHSDSYSFVATKNQYSNMYDDHFDLLDTIRAINEAGDNELTISMGIAYGTNDYVKLNELAASSLDVCLSRGGDQVVIQPYGENLIFIGGKYEAKSKRNRVKVRILSKSLETLISDAKKVYIMGHKDADLDAIGSSVGLLRFVNSCGIEGKIVYDERLIELKTKKAFKQSYSRDAIREMTISPKDAIEAIDENTLLICTDVHRPSMTLEPKLLEKANKIAVIDHHRRGEEFIDSPVYSYVEPAASSASELVIELIRYNEKKITISESDATMLLSGILLDTNYYRNKTGPRTYDASVVLKEFGADNLIADSFLKEEFEEHALKVKIMSSALTPYTGVVVCRAGEEDTIDRTMLAIVANETLQIKGVNACFVVGKTDTKVVSISARSDGSVNVQYIMEKLGGGGHFAQAGTQMSDRTIDEVYRLLGEALSLYLSDSRTEKK